ncbi:MAG: glycosyltransferase, partial [Actinomycetota bacterium]
VRWDEPFGLVAVEALACGTPVVALANGALPEIVRDRVTGFLCKRPADLVGALGELDRIDPAACRRDAETRFTADRMVERYEAVYETAVARTSRPMLATAS